MTYSIVPYQSNYPAMKSTKVIILKKRKPRKTKTPKITVIKPQGRSSPFSAGSVGQSPAPNQKKWVDVTPKPNFAAMAKLQTKQENAKLRLLAREQRKQEKAKLSVDRRKQRARAASTRKHKRIARKIWRRLI
jgi:hypothetical protein